MLFRPQEEGLGVAPARKLFAYFIKTCLYIPHWGVPAALFAPRLGEGSYLFAEIIYKLRIAYLHLRMNI